MNFGYIRVATGIPNQKVANCKYNMSRIIYLVNEALKKHVQIIVFPELSITSYTCGDLFYQQTLLDCAESQLSELLDLTKRSHIVIIVGMPIRTNNQLYNCAVIIQKGEILGVVPKTYIPNYSEFYEKRWFVPATNIISNHISVCNRDVPFGTDILFKSGNLCFGIEICEDLWMPIPPSNIHCINGANLIFNLSASNETIGKSDYRKQLIKQQSAKLVTGYVYVSAGSDESTTDVVFAGNSMIAENGLLLTNSMSFDNNDKLYINEIDIERLNSDRRKCTTFTDCLNNGILQKKDYRIINFNLQQIEIYSLNRQIDDMPFVPKDAIRRTSRCNEVFSIQVAGLSKRIKHINSKHAVIGISGGLDSTLALLVTAKTFDKLNIPRQNILAITMPGFGTTNRTYNNAVGIINALNSTNIEINIKDACIQHFKDIEHDPSIHDTTYENVQARERTQILMDIANKEKGIVIGTGDLSELALGWATYNGDHMSMYGVNSGVPKTLVRFLIEWVAQTIDDNNIKAILKDILDTPVSPELLPADNKDKINQKTEDIIGPYELHDFFLYNMIRFCFPPFKIFFLAKQAFKEKYSDDIIKKWLKIFYRRFFTQQFKRSCLPDGPKVGSINLSPRGDWRMPSDASWAIWMDDIQNI